MDNKLDNILKGSFLVGAPVALNFLNVGICMGTGYLVGEIMDQIPYLSEAISRTLNETVNTEYFTNNLDKVGVAVGFLRYPQQKIMI